MNNKKRMISLLAGLLVLLFSQATEVNACTGIRLKADDGSIIYGRTMEWGSFDMHSRVAIVPRGFAFTGLTPDGFNGKKWKSKYGFVAVDMLERDVFGDGMNEKGLAAGLFYFPGFADYPGYDKAKAANTITAVDVLSYILSKFSTVGEVRRAMQDVRVVPVVEKALGIPMQAHWMVTDPSGQSIIIEYLNKELHIFDAPLGVITNAPSYDWHVTNLRNYVNLSAVAIPSKKLEDMNFAPLGAGSGMIGLPGDFTPPSRFIRAVAWTQTHRPLKDSTEAMYEFFRILDNFNVPLGSAEGSDLAGTNLEGLRSSTCWTTCWDISKKVLYFHTQHNRRVRKVDMKRIDFSKKEITHIPLDEKREQDIKDITPVN